MVADLFLNPKRYYNVTLKGGCLDPVNRTYFDPDLDLTVTLTEERLASFLKEEVINGKSQLIDIEIVGLGD